MDGKLIPADKCQACQLCHCPCLRHLLVCDAQSKHGCLSPPKVNDPTESFQASRCFSLGPWLLQVRPALAGLSWTILMCLPRCFQLPLKTAQIIYTEVSQTLCAKQRPGEDPGTSGCRHRPLSRPARPRGLGWQPGLPQWITATLNLRFN